MDYLAHPWEAAMEDGQWKIRLAMSDGERLRQPEHDDYFVGVAFTHPQHDAIVRRIVDLHNAALG